MKRLTVLRSLLLPVLLSGCASAWGPAVEQGKLLNPLEHELRSLVAACGMRSREAAAEGGDTTLPPLLYGARVGQTFVRELNGTGLGATTPELVFDAAYTGEPKGMPSADRRTDYRLTDDGHVTVRRDDTAGGSYRYHCKSYAYAALEGGVSLAGVDAKAALEGKHETTSAVTIHVGRFISDLGERLATADPMARQEALAFYLRHPELATKGPVQILRAVTAAVVLVTESGTADTQASGSIGWSGTFGPGNVGVKVGNRDEAKSSGDAKNAIVTVADDATWVTLPPAADLARGLTLEAAVAPDSFSFVMENVPAEVVLLAKVAKPLCQARWWKVEGPGRELVRVVYGDGGCRFGVRVDWTGLDAAQKKSAGDGEVRVPLALRAAVGPGAGVDLTANVALRSGQEPVVVLKSSEPAASDREVAFSFDIWTSIVTDEFARRFKVGQTWGAPLDAKVACGATKLPVNVRVHQPVQTGAPPTLWLAVPRADIEPYAGRGCTFSVTLSVPVSEREGGGSRQVKWVLQDRRLDVPAWIAPPVVVAPVGRNPGGTTGGALTSEPAMSEPAPTASPLP
ncbi:MAG: hypothetical protein IV100_32070 [Myxococcales bacterium]|nr:hypothetical protein [Myxococcales bacterium]